jgi:Zinc carboxypeptidase
MKVMRLAMVLMLAMLVIAPGVGAQAPKVTTPQQEWGKELGADYFLVNYQQLMAYWKKLDAESPRITLEEIGKTSEGRPMLMAIITSPANQKNIARYKQISTQLARAENLTDARAQALAREGKAVVWIDGGLHATETLGAQQLVEHVYRMASLDDAETRRILDDVVQLVVLVNPDGMDLVSDWYMKHGNMNTPVLYNKYAGHDDNRDFYMSALAESTNINRIMYREWIPQIMYNHHQTGPAGTVMFAPPFRDPFNYNFHPYAVAGIDVVGSMMAERFIMEGKPGVTSRRGAPYSTWFNGGIRTTAHFHNIIGILTETIGNPNPINIPFLPAKQLGDSNMWWPIAPQQEWHMRQSVEYSMTANRAILDYASRYRERVLYNMYVMGRDEKNWGNEDHWTFTPHKMAKVQADLIAKGVTQGTAIPGAASTSNLGGGGRGGGGGGRGGGGGPDPLHAAMTSKDMRDPRAFVLPSDQPDFATATKFVNTLIKTGIVIHRATAPFTVNGKTYPANSYVVKTSQAFRPHVMDMFEPQDHPDDIPYPGGPPTPPYDSTGYTLAYQMGVKFDRILDAFDGQFVELTDFAKAPTGTIGGAQTPVGYYFSHQVNDSFTAINRLLKAGEEVSWLADGPMGPGTFYVPAKASTRANLQKVTDLGVNFQPAPSAPTGTAMKLRAPRIALFDTYGGGMPSGWTRMILENFEFPYELVFPPDLDKGGLRAKYDVIVFNDAGAPGGGGGARGGGPASAGAQEPPPATAGASAATSQAASAAQTSGRAAGTGATGQGRGGGAGAAGQGRGGGGRAGFTPAPIPEEYARRQGNVTAQTMAQIKQFVEEGGSVIAIGGVASAYAQQFGRPVTNHLTENGQALPREKFFAPGCVLEMTVDPKNPLAHGVGAKVDVFFDNNPVFAMSASAASAATAGQAGSAAARPATHAVAWFASPTPLRSGWAWGEKYFDKGIGIVEANVGKGRVFIFGPEILFRAQPHGTFKFFFNGLYLSAGTGSLQ